MQPESEEACSEVRLHYDSPACCYKKGGAPGNHLVASPSYLSPKSKTFLNPSDDIVGVSTPPTSKASSSPGNDYSPMSSYSRGSSGSVVIDHTALLLGLYDEFEEESDDEAKHCCFSPMASVDALDGAVDSDSDESETTGSEGPPLQLTIDTANRGVMMVTDNNIGGADLSLVARQLDCKDTITKAGGKSEDTVLLKAASVKAKTSSVFSAKAQKAKKKTLDVITPKIALTHVISTRKSEQRIHDELSTSSSKGKLAAKHASERVSAMKDKAAQKAHEVKDKAAHKAHRVKDMTLEVVGRKTYHKADELSHNGSHAMSLLSDDVGSEGSGGSGSAKATKRALKMPKLPRPPKTLSLKKGTINKKFMISSLAAKRTQSKDTIDQDVVEQHYQSSVRSPSALSSVISPTNSYDMSSCIDADGFLLSPQSSLGFISPTASIDELNSSGIDGNMGFDAFSDDGFDSNFETSATSRVHSITDDDSELLAKELKAAIQNKARKPPLLPPSGRPRYK